MDLIAALIQGTKLGVVWWNANDTRQADGSILSYAGVVRSFDILVYTRGQGSTPTAVAVQLKSGSGSERTFSSDPSLLDGTFAADLTANYALLVEAIRTCKHSINKELSPESQPLMGQLEGLIAAGGLTC